MWKRHTYYDPTPSGTQTSNGKYILAPGVEGIINFDKSMHTIRVKKIRLKISGKNKKLGCKNDSSTVLDPL